jgi:hypothetical protein
MTNQGKAAANLPEAPRTGIPTRTGQRGIFGLTGPSVGMTSTCTLCTVSRRLVIDVSDSFYIEYLPQVTERHPATLSNEEALRLTVGQGRPSLPSGPAFTFRDLVLINRIADGVGSSGAAIAVFIRPWPI